VFRRLAQDVPGWWGQVAGARPDGDMAAADRLGAKLVGRWRSGTPLANAPLSDRRSARSKSSDNDFNYDNDPDGIKTPRFAHIRKVYPRGPQTEERFGSEQHRIMRRGIPYGLQFDPAGGRGHGVDAERGLVFNMFCARIENQFEFLQRTWANNPDFPETGDGRDPVIGTTPDGSAAPVTLKEQGQPDEVLNLRRFVATRGSLYALAVSRPGLKALASGKV
jgi:deferrochelatase/peroxidase EfeB